MQKVKRVSYLYTLRHKGQTVLTGYGDGLQTFNSRRSAVSYVEECVDLYDHSKKDYEIITYKEVR